MWKISARLPEFEILYVIARTQILTHDFLPAILKIMLSLLIQHQEISFALRKSLEKAGMMLTSLSFNRNACVFQ